MDEILNYSLLTIGSYQLKVSNIVGLVLFILALFLVLLVIKKAIYGTNKFDETKKYTLNQLIRYFLIVISIIIGFQILGFNVSVILAGSAALLVGLGLGMQNLFSDFISGIIILTEGSFKIDDVIEVNSTIYQVKEINLRTTKVLGRDENIIILPNSLLTSEKNVNWTHDNYYARFKIEVGVSYSSDIDVVMEVLKETTLKNPNVSREMLPFARFEDYGESSLNFAVYFWSDEIFGVEFIKSELRIAIFKAFKENKIEIPFPQRVVHSKIT